MEKVRRLDNFMRRENICWIVFLLQMTKEKLKLNLLLKNLFRMQLDEKLMIFIQYKREF